MKVLDELSKLRRSPVKLSGDRIEEGNSVKIHPSDSVLIVDKDVILYLVFEGDLFKEKTAYRYWAFSRIFKIQVSGSGEVYEKYLRVARVGRNGVGSSMVVDNGSKLVVDAEIAEISWSKGDFLYMREGVKVQPSSSMTQYRDMVNKDVNK